MDLHWRIQLFGALRAERADRVITRFRTQKTAALLAYLAYYRHVSHPRELLIDLLWPEDDLDTSRKKLRDALTSLRRQFEPPGTPAGTVLMTDRASVQMNPAVCATDVAAFEAAIAAARDAGSALEHAGALDEAVELYRGELLPGQYEEWTAVERARLGGLHHQALGTLLRLVEEQGDRARAIAIARRAVAAEPLCEETWRDLIRLLGADGQTSAARQQYRQLEKLLRRELDSAPSAATREILALLRPRRTPAGDPAKPPLTAVASALPPGTVTLLLIERTNSKTASTPDGSCNGRLAGAVAQHGGQVIREACDSCLAMFARATEAVTCALAIHAARTEPPPAAHAVLAVTLPDAEPSRPPPPGRIAMHTCEVQPGRTLAGSNDTAVASAHLTRLLLAGHAGQLLCTEPTAALLRRHPVPGIYCVDLGLYRLRGEETPEHFYQIESPGAVPRSFPPLQAEGARTAALPPRFTRFFGRDEELAHLTALLLAEETRLVTLTGPGGSGKTRLAVEVAARLVEALSAAVWFVPLADVADPRRIPDTLRDALRLRPTPGITPMDQVIDVLARQPALLVLDNFEHLLAENLPNDGGTSVIQALLTAVPRLTCLVTSRQRLCLGAEREFPVLPLATPAAGVPAFGRSGVTTLRRSGGERGASVGTERPDSVQPTEPPNARTPERLYSPERLIRFPSVQLFVDRAQAARADFQVTRANAGAVADVCDRLEGLPLALELAAARASVLAPAQMLAHLDRRFEFLVSRRPDLPPRHRTLWATLDWSYRLLEPDLQRFFERLAVFHGGWTLEAAEAVAGPPVGREGARALDALQRLQECSLLVVAEAGEGVRYRMLETVREYAWERLTRRGEAADVCRHHLQYYRRLAEASEQEFRGVHGAAALQQLATESENLRAALEWAAENDTRAGLRLANALWQFWQLQGYWSEARGWMERYLAPGGDALLAVRAEALTRAGKYAYQRREYGPATACFEEGLALYRRLGNRRQTAYLLYEWGVMAAGKGDTLQASALLEESLTIYAELADRIGMGACLHGLGGGALSQGSYGKARHACEQALELFRGEGDRHFCQKPLLTLGHIARRLDDHAGARRYYEESLALRAELGNQLNVAFAHELLGHVALSQGEYAQARMNYEAALAICREFEGKPVIARTLLFLGRLARLQEDVERAGALYEESLELCHALENAVGTAHALAQLGRLARQQGDVSRARVFYEESMAIYSERGARDAVTCLLDELGHTALGAGDPRGARALYEQSLAIRMELGDHTGSTTSRLYLGDAALAAGDLVHARGLFQSCLERYRAARDAVSPGQHPATSVPSRPGESESARALHDSGPAIRRELGGRRGIADALAGLGRVALAAGDLGEARRCHTGALAIHRELGEQRETALALLELGDIARAAGAPTKATAHYLESLALAAAMSIPSLIARCRERLADPTHRSSR